LYRYGSFYGSGIVVQELKETFSIAHSRVMIHQPSGGAQGVATDMEINLEKC
jgi:ATP-dependent Clp protease protease subunit